MFETPDGIIDISGYNDQQKSAFFEKYPDAKQVESDSPSIEELASMGEDREFSDLVSYAREEQVVEPENAEEWASTLAKQKKYYNNNYPKAPSVKPLSETLPEEEEIDPFDPFGIYKEKEELQVEAARQSGSMSDIGQQTFVLDAPEPVSEEREIELGAPSAKTPKDFYNKYDLNVATSDANMYYYDKEPAPDLAYEKSSDWFVKKYYPNIKGLPNKLDLQGHLNKLGITKDFYKKDTEGGFKYVPSAQAGVKRVFSGEGFEAEEFQKISKELELEIHLNNYIQELHEKNTAKEFYKDYEKNPKKYDSFKTMDLAYNSFVEENGGLIPAFDTSILDLWKKNNFTSLNKYKEDLVKKEEEYYNKTLKDGTAKSALDKISNWVEYKTYGAMENVGVLGDLFTGAMLDVTGIDPRYMNRSISSKNLVDISDKKQKHFVSLGGLKAKVGEEEYIKGQDGTIYNVANSLPISGKVSDKQYQRINSIIDKVGKYDVEYSGYGLSVHGGRMLGNLLADVALVKGLGKVRYAASSKYINRTNAIRKAKGLKPINLQARNLKTGKFAKGSTKGTFGKNLAVDIRTYETTLYYGTSGYSKGYSSTFNQAKQAGLTDSEAEKLALIAAPMTSVIYGSTGPLNPRIPLLDKIDDIFMKAGVAKQAVSDYKNKGVIGFVESFKRGVSNFGKEVYKTGTAISKEIGEEVIQEGSEVYVVNPKINEIASQEFLTQEMTADDLRNTAILSSTAAGMTNVNLRSAVGGFSMSPENRLSNLHKLSENIDYSQKVLNHFVTRGEITQEQADDIIDQAKAIKSYAPKAPAWMVNDPAAFIDAAIKGSQIEKLEAEKKNLDEQATFEIDERIEALKEDKKNIIDSAAGRAVKEQTDVIKKKTDKIESFSDPEKMIEFLEAKAKKEGKEYNIKTKIADLESDGFMIDDDGTIIINEKVAVETQAISVASHELLHKILKSEFANNKEMARIVDEFKQILKDKGLFDTIDERMQKNYRDRGVDVDNLKNADEYFTALSDMIGKNQVSRDQLQDSVLMELGRKIVKIFKTRFGLKNARFETGQDVFDFIKDYQKNIQKGKLTKQAELKLKEFVPGGTDRSRSILKDINNLVPKEVKTKQDFQDAKVFNPIYEATLPGGAIYNYVNSRSTSREEAEITLEGVVDRLINFDPAAVRKTAGGDPITFGEFLFANARFSKLDAKKKLAIESERRAESLDTEEARQVAEPVAETTTTEAPRVEYQNLVEASVLPAEMVSKVKDKILLITKTLKSRIDAATSINKTVTPLMSEIKKEIGKQADIEFKKMLGAKRGGELRNNFLKLKKPILENMTTTWLMQGMPFAIQKSVDGKFTSDWEGKKIDRESVGTDKAGRTSGAQLVRRLPNAANKITDEQFLTYMFKGDEVIRGRKEALSKGLAEEYALDVYREQLLDPESEIRKAFIENQERIGVEIAENTIQEFFRQAERGNVKRSVSIPIDELRGEVKVIIARIKKKGSDITNVIDVENSEIIDEELKKKKLSQMAIDLIVHGFGNNLIDFEKQRRYVEGILSNPIIPEYIKKGFKTIDKNSDIKIRKAFAESVTDFAADLDPKVIELLGVDFLGFINRVLDPAAKKIDEVATQKAMDEYFRKNGKKGKGLTKYLKDKFGKNITGDFYKEFLNILNLSGKPGDLPNDIDMSKVRPMNTSISNGLFDRINRILNNKKGKNYDYSKLDAKGKKAELAKFVPEIEEANKHNKKLFKYLIKKLINSNIPDTHFLQLLQLQTQAVKGFRSLTALKYFTITDGPMGSPKGEHLADNAGTMEEIAELRYLGLKGKALDAKIDEILEYHDQWISARKTLDLVDAIGGVTNKNKDKRILLLPESEVKEVFTIYGDPATGLIDKRSDNIEKVNKIRKGVLNNQKNADLEKALSNSRKRSYSENPKGISVYDFDDTLAFSKSGVRYTAPNTSGKSAPQRKAILLMGSSGAGKSTIIDKLGLRKKGFKYVNQDIALDWLTKNSGLPKNMNEFTREQAQKWRELQYEAAGAAKDKASTLRGKGDGVVIDSPGGDIRTVSRQFKDAGYDVQVIFVNSSLENALARNKARGERRLSDTAVKNSWEKVQKSIKGTKELVDVFPKSVKEFVEINTDNIKQGQDLPSEFVGKINSFTDGYVKGRINAEQFAAQGEALLANGAEFDFSEFNKVVEGEPGPLIPRIQKAIDKFGNKNIFILTARPVAAESAIHTFMKGLGIGIPRANIKGLANSTAQAKADWMVGKVAEGFNDFYFVDDAIKNVKAVKDVLETFDVKSKVQQAIANRKRSMSSDLNEMIERNTGVRAETTYSKVLARKKGAKKGKFKFFVPYSAEDFKGLTSYTLAGKGKQGEADQRFFDRNLILPYTRGIAAMEGATQALKNDYKNLLNMFGLKKQLPKKIGDTDFTTDQAVRVYLWDQQGFDIPNISKRDQNKLSKLVAKDPDLVGFAEGLMAVSKKDNWVKPKEHWDVGSILKDLNDITDNVNRKEYLAEFIENVDEMFDKTTLNKLEAIYGTNYVEALQDSIRRMKSGSNSPRSAGKIEQKWLNWVNNSVGTIMFFNRRSALLQMLSFTNFINWSDNNPAKAAAAFANQPLYWKKWVEIFNSDKLKERRGGLKSDIQESEIANQAKNSKDKASAVISYLLKIGFTPTQIADSFAIATGGATFLINRTKKYQSEGFSKKEAEAKAFEDFGRISDETQQSGDPMLISQQQASHLGRLVLAFQNTPMQYTRLMKKAGKDIYNRRGSDVENLSKIAYYGFVQNLIFSSLQSALFALIPGFDDEEEEDAKVEDKVIRTANSMVDTILRGTGLAGAVISTLKNAIMRYQKEDKKGYTADHTYTMIELANISPPIGSKLRKVYSAIQTKKFNQAAIDEMGYDLTIDGKFNPSPNYEIIANVSSAVGNLPLDRLLSEVKSINEAFDSRNTSYQRLALALGWRTWGVNVKNEEQDLIKVKAKAAKKEAGKRKAKETKKLKKKRKLDRVRSMTDEEMKALRAASSKRKEEARQRILAEREKSSK